MSVETDLFTLLKNATDAGTKVYPLVAPDSILPPYLVYSNIADNSENVLAGVTTLSNGRIQIDAYALSFLASKTLSAQVKALMAGWAVQNVSYPSTDSYENETEYFRVMMEFSVWHL